MEIHHHPEPGKKNFKEYFLEFLMIFLAVTLGFFAENLREHFAQNSSTKEYLEACRDELLQQQQLFDRYKGVYQRQIVACDSIKSIFFSKQENSKIDVVKRFLVPSVTQTEIPFNTSSYDQMVSAGALRFIGNIDLRDSLATYKGQIEILKNFNARFLQTLFEYMNSVARLIDFHDLVAADTSISYDQARHNPQMQDFDPLTNDQRREIVFFFETHIAQGQSNLKLIRKLEISNKRLLEMVNDQIDN